MSELINNEITAVSSNDTKIIEKENEIQQPILLEHIENPPKKLPENSDENRGASKVFL